MEGCKRPQRTYISKTYIDAEFDVESFRMVYLASKGRLGKVICEKHTFLNSPLPSTVRVSLLESTSALESEKKTLYFSNYLKIQRLEIQLDRMIVHEWYI